MEYAIERSLNGDILGDVVLHKTESRLPLQVPRNHAGAATVAALDLAAPGERLERLAHRHSRDAELRGQLSLAG